jgi:hypothetical protein
MEGKGRTENRSAMMAHGSRAETMAIAGLLSCLRWSLIWMRVLWPGPASLYSFFCARSFTLPARGEWTCWMLNRQKIWMEFITGGD